ncbi:MAG TPA: siderophore-interacting protein [Stenotrophomonas sp.]|nr:siderophore-interacting protein [Stenotrophomonas sp.]
MTEHAHQRLRHLAQLRELTVVRCEGITPHMRRIVLGGAALEGFHSASPDDHVKLFFPNAEGAFITPTMTPEGPRWPEGALPSPTRDYTPRWHDAEAGELAIDFVLHGDGAASSWAQQAKTGDALVVGGPRGSFVVAGDYDQYVLFGDETALPAIGRWLEEMPEDRVAEVFIEIADESERQVLESEAEVRVHWLERNGVDAASSRLLEETLRDFELPDGETFFWIATESKRARMMRKFIEGQLGVPSDSIRATGYWQAGADAE